MRFLKRWRFLLIILVCVGVARMSTAYVRSPAYRAAQAYARIHEGMSRDEAKRILGEWGGEYSCKSQVCIRGLIFDCPEEVHWFGDDTMVAFEFEPNPSDVQKSIVTKKHIRRPTFTESLWSSVESMKSALQPDSSDANERMQQLLNDPENNKQIRQEWQRFKELDKPVPPSTEK